MAVRKVFGDIRFKTKRCTLLPMVFRVRMLMCYFLQVKMKNRRFGQGHAEVWQNMIAPASVGCRCPLMNNYLLPMSQHSPFERVSYGSAHHKVSEVTRSLRILGILSQMCLITFATYCVMRTKHFGWRRISVLLNTIHKVEARSYISRVPCGNRFLKPESRTSNLMAITSGSIVGVIRRTVRLCDFIVQQRLGGVSHA